MFEQDNMSEAERMTDGADWMESDFPAHWVDRRKKSKLINGVAAYRCTKCGQYKPKSDYYKDKRVPCGIRDKCKLCYHKK